MPIFIFVLLHVSIFFLCISYKRYRSFYVNWNAILIWNHFCVF